MKQALYLIVLTAVFIARSPADSGPSDGLAVFKQFIKSQADAVQCLALKWTVTQTLNAQSSIENVIDYSVNLQAIDKYRIEQNFDQRNLYKYIGDDKIVYTISDQQRHIAVADDPKKVLGDIIEGIPIVFMSGILNFESMGEPSEVQRENGGIKFVWKAAKGDIEIQFSEATQTLNKISINRDGVERLSYVCGGNAILNGVIPSEVTLIKRKSDGSLYLSQHWKLISGDYNPALRKIDLSYALPKGYGLQYVVAGKSFESRTDDLLSDKGIGN